jgi:hypothetical protein
VQDTDVRVGAGSGNTASDRYKESCSRSGGVGCLPRITRHKVEAFSRSVLVPTLKRYPVCLTAANPDASLDVLYYLVKQSPAHFFLRRP